MAGLRWDETHAEPFPGDGDGAIWRPRPGLLFTRARGRVSAAMARFYIAAAQDELAGTKRLYVFHDWLEVASYETEARDLLRAFGKTVADGRLRAHYLVRSKIVSMAIQTAALVLGRELASTSQRAEFERWQDAAISALRADD